MGKSYVKQRKRMWDENPHCRNCGSLTWLPEKGKKEDGNMATIDHKYCRLDERRYTAPSKEKSHVLLCKKCNYEKHVAEQNQFMLQQIEASKNGLTRIKNPDINGWGCEATVAMHLYEILIEQKNNDYIKYVNCNIVKIRAHFKIASGAKSKHILDVLRLHYEDVILKSRLTDKIKSHLIGVLRFLYKKHLKLIG